MNQNEDPSAEQADEDAAGRARDIISTGLGSCMETAKDAGISPREFVVGAISVFADLVLELTICGREEIVLRDVAKVFNAMADDYAAKTSEAPS